MSLPPATSAQLHAAILQYITQLQAGGASDESGVKDAEPLEIALQCLIEATGADAKDAPKIDASLLEVFSRGLASVSAVDSNPKFATFLALLKEKAFFDGATAGSAEYSKRMGQARKKFEERASAAASSPASDAVGASSAPAPAAAAAVAVEEITALTKSQAEAAKNEGNALLGKADYAGAVEKYSEAIRLNPTSAIYFANRAAAFVNLKQYAKAVTDCKDSIRLDPNYAKAYYRQGQSLAALGDYEACLAPFEKALALSAKDEGMAVTIREQIRVAKNKLNPPADSDMGVGHAGGDDPFAAMGGMGGLSSLLSGLGGAGGAGGMDFGALLNNPAIGQMMQDPRMMDMMKNMMGGMGGGAGGDKDGGLAGLMGGMAQGMANAPKETEVDTSYRPPAASALFDDDDAPAAAPAAAKPAAAAAPKPAAAASGAPKLPPQLSAFLATPAGQAAAADPELKPVLEDIKANGIGAAMKYMSNPAIMQKITALMGPMMGGGR